MFDCFMDTFESKKKHRRQFGNKEYFIEAFPLLCSIYYVHNLHEYVALVLLRPFTSVGNKKLP